MQAVALDCLLWLAPTVREKAPHTTVLGCSWSYARYHRAMIRYEVSNNIVGEGNMMSAEDTPAIARCRKGRL
jgi:hypothetical protein